MELGIPKCAIIGCPNNKPMPATTFKAYIQSHNIKYRNQPIPVLHQNEPYVYLGIQLIPSLKWKSQQAITMNKLIKQTQLLLNSPATLKQKLKMVDTVIRPGIAYSFYAVPYSMPNITKLDKKIIGLQKSICGLPRSTPNITTKLPHDQYGLDAHSLKTEYLTCIGQQLRNALNDPGRLGTIYKGLTNHIFAKYGGSQNLPSLNKEACLHSPTSRTLYLLKHNGKAHIQTDNTTSPHMETPLTTIWLQKASNYPTITPNISRKYLHQLLLLNITTLEQITLPNRTTIMNEKEFQQYHKKITPTIKKALKIASHIFCTTNCLETCRPPCNIHPQTFTLLPEITNRPNQTFLHTPFSETNPPTSIPELPKPPKRMQKLQDYPISTITDKKHSKRTDKLGTLKKFTSYKCQWTQPENHNYAMWMPTDKVFLHNKPNITDHNLRLLKQFYLTKQHKHYQDIIAKNFHQIQSKDTRYIQEPLQLPLVQIQLTECNPDTDINTVVPTIQIIQDKALIFTNIGNHLITIPKQRLEWLWHQYNTNLNTQHQLDPPCQSFEIEIIWLYKRYKYRIPKTDPLKESHFTLPIELLDQIITIFNITTSYFSSPVTCSTLINTYYSPFQRDSIFRAKGTAFKHKWLGNGYAHPHNKENLQKAIHWPALPLKKTTTQSLSSPFQTKNGPQTRHHTRLYSMTHMSSYISHPTL
jgi:hypothetical protein